MTTVTASTATLPALEDLGIFGVTEVHRKCLSGDKVRVLAVSDKEGWHKYRNEIIGEEFILQNTAGHAQLYYEHDVDKGSILAQCGKLVILNQAGTLFEKVNEEDYMAIVKEKRISRITGKLVRKYTKAGESPVEVREEKVKVENVMDKSGFVTLNDYFKVSRGIYKILKKNIESNRSTLLLGPTGVGKTEMFANIAKEMGLPFTIFDMGTMSDPIMSLVGNHVIKVVDGKTVSEFKKSRFSEVIQKPGIVLLDELSRANATANNLLFPCLDFRRELAMEYCFEGTESIKVHPECVFVATANLGSQYTGTHKLDRALLDRFMLIEIDPLTTEQIKETLKHHRKDLNATDIIRMVDIYNKINKAHDDYTISFNMSLRHLKMIAELVSDGFTIYDSFYVTCKGIGGVEGLKAIESIINTVK